MGDFNEKIAYQIVTFGRRGSNFILEVQLSVLQSQTLSSTFSLNGCQLQAQVQNYFRTQPYYACPNVHYRRLFFDGACADVWTCVQWSMGTSRAQRQILICQVCYAGLKTWLVFCIQHSLDAHKNATNTVLMLTKIPEQFEKPIHKCLTLLKIYCLGSK